MDYFLCRLFLRFILHIFVDDLAPPLMRDDQRDGAKTSVGLKFSCRLNTILLRGRGRDGVICSLLQIVQLCILNLSEIQTLAQHCLGVFKFPECLLNAHFKHRPLC